MRSEATPPHRPVALVLAAGVAWLLLGPVAGIVAATSVVWTVFGRGDRDRLFAAAGLTTLVAGVSWLAAGTPSDFEVVAFVNEGGRHWIDAPARAAVALVIMALAAPEVGAAPRPARSSARIRLPEVDRLRAWGIVAVVVIHALPFRAPVTAYIDYWLSDLLRFSVALLFFVSGWLLPRPPTGWSWVRRRLLRILPPYLVASALMLALAQVSPLIDRRPVLESLLLGDAVGPYYFVVVLVALTVVTPLFQRLRWRTQCWFLALAAGASLAIELADLPLYLHNHLAFTWLPFYLAGHLLRPLREIIAAMPEAVRGSIVGVTAVLTLVLGVLPIETTPRRLVTWITMWAVLALLLVLAMAATSRPSGLTQRLGQQSYLIYLYHPPIVAGIAGAFGSSVLTLTPLVAAVTALGLCLLAGTVARVAWPRHAGRWLGA